MTLGRNTKKFFKLAKAVLEIWWTQNSQLWDVLLATLLDRMTWNFDIICPSPSCIECKKLHHNSLFSFRDIKQCLSQTDTRTDRQIADRRKFFYCIFGIRDPQNGYFRWEKYMLKKKLSPTESNTFLSGK